MSQKPLTNRPTKRRPAEEQDKLIEAALKDAGRPVSAYDIIDHLRDEAKLAPQTVYRALDRLIARGSVHRLESLNAFVACSHADHEHTSHQQTAIFAICDTCRAVTEFNEAETIEALSSAAGKSGFSVRAMTLELRGECATCTEKAGQPTP